MVFLSGSFPHPLSLHPGVHDISPWPPHHKGLVPLKPSVNLSPPPLGCLCSVCFTVVRGGTSTELTPEMQNSVRRPDYVELSLLELVVGMNFEDFCDVSWRNYKVL